MPSVKRALPRFAVVCCCGSLLLGFGSGCSTTQEKAAAHQAESERILERRAARQKHRKEAKQDRKNGKNAKDEGKKQ